MIARGIIRLAVTVFAVGLGAAAGAQQVNQETPRGEIRTAPVSGVLWEKAAFTGAPGVVIAEGVRANWGSAEAVDLPAGSTLMVIRERKLKACRARTATRLGGYSFGGWDDCLIDSNQDGLFDKVSFNEVGGAKNIIPPVAYTKAMVPIAGEGSASFRKTITFLGKSGSDVRLSYREFSNDMARPAFTEDLTLPFPASFPETMVVKDIRLTILGLDSSGLRYRLD